MHEPWTDPIRPDADLGVLLRRLRALESEADDLRSRRHELEAEAGIVRSLPRLPAASLFEANLRGREARERLPALRDDLDRVEARLDALGAGHEAVMASLESLLPPGQWIRDPLHPRLAVCLATTPGGYPVVHTAPWRLARHSLPNGEPGTEPGSDPAALRFYATLERSRLGDALLTLSAVPAAAVVTLWLVANLGDFHQPPLLALTMLLCISFAAWAAAIVFRVAFVALEYRFPRRPLHRALSEHAALTAAARRAGGRANASSAYRAVYPGPGRPWS